MVSFLSPVIWLTMSFIIYAVDSSIPCPSGCECRKEDVQPFGELLSVTCFELSEMPDLSVLLQTKMGKNVRLDENDLTTIGASDFPPGLNITILNLSQNEKLHISDDAFLNLGMSLRILKLEAIDLAFSGTLKMLEPLFSLKELSLNYNNKQPYVKGAVQDIVIPMFKGQVANSITSLKLAFCGIRTMSKTSLGDLKKLKELELSNNWFKVVPEVVNYLPSLTFIELFYCSLESIEDYSFSSLKHLKALDLSSNKNLKTIEDKAFSGLENSLEKLLLSRCNLSDIPTKALKDLKKLTRLDISENNYPSIEEGAFEGEFKLRGLLISSKDMQFTANMFQGQEENIKDLSVARMGLKTIPLEPLRKLTNLKSLNLEYNEISVLSEKAFDGISASTLYLGHNPVSSIDPNAFEGLPSNLVINLKNTQMDNIDFLQGYSESAIDTVDLKHSKLVCRCSMKSSLNATENIKMFGSCTKGSKTLSISSYDLEEILDQACEEEKAAADNGARTAHWTSDCQMKLVFGLAWLTIAYLHLHK